jgi:hypothetical protein
MIELVRVQAFDEANLVDDLSEVRQAIAQPGPAPAMLTERILRPQQLWDSLDEREPFALQILLRTILPVVTVQFRLVVEQFQMTGRAGHVQEDHAFGLGPEVRLPGCQWPSRITGQHPWRGAKHPPRLRGQPHGTQSRGTIAQEMPARQPPQMIIVHFRAHSGNVADVEREDLPLPSTGRGPG